MSTTRNCLAGLGASLLILLLVVGTPALLIAIGATPWNASLRGLGTLLTSPDDGTLAMLVIGVVAWCAWAVMAVSFAVEILAALRGVPAPRLPGLAVPQGMAGRLVAVAALLFAVAPTAVPVFTPPPSHASPPFAAPPLVNLRETPPQAPVEPTEAPASTADHTTPTVKYTVRRGDSLWKIAEEHLGDGMRFREIVALNEDVLHGQPSFIDPGLVLRLPSDGESTDEQSEEPSAGEKYVVEPGDTLWGIAEDELGEGERYPEIFHASRDTVQTDEQKLTDPDLIRPGWEVTIPASANGSPVGDPPDEPSVVPPSGTPHEPDPVETNPPAEIAESATPTAEPDESSAASEVDTSDDEGASMSWLLPGLMGAGALLAGSLLVTLRAHRRTQQRNRRVGHTIAPPPAELRAIEKTAFVAGGPAAAATNKIDQLLRHLAATMDEQPKLHTVEVGQQSVTLHLAEPAELPEPWSGFETSWSADLAAPVGDEDVLPPYPLLTSIGQSEDGHLWLVDLEQFGIVALAGDSVRAASLARHIAAELALSPWAVIARVDTLDVAPELAALDDHRLRIHPADSADFIDQLQQDLTRAMNDGHGDPEPYRVVIGAGDRGDRVRTALAELIQRQTSRSGCAVISVGDPAPGDAVIEVDADGRLRMPELDLDLTAAGLSADEAAATAAIVDLTRETTVAPMPREQGASGWRALADHTGALISEMTEPRPPGEAGDASLLPEATQRYKATAPATAEDVEALAPVVPTESSRIVEETDPQLDDDLAEWRDPASELPKLQLLGPVTVIARDEPPTAVAERRAYFTELVAFLALHPAGVSSRQVRDAFGMTQSRARTDLGYIRSWFGSNPRTGEFHLPPATTSPAHKDRGASGYQLNDVLVDLDLFRRLHARAQARGADGMADLVAALELVTGEPFSTLRNPGWSWLLDDERVHETAAFAVVDVAHVVATDAFSRGDLDRAKFAAETGCTAAPYDEVCRLDLAKVAQAEGHDALAEQILDEHVYNRTDDHLPPIDLPKRTKAVVKQGGWGGQGGVRKR